MAADAFGPRHPAAGRGDDDVDDHYDSNTERHLKGNQTIRGHVHMMSAVGGGEGGTPKADVVREVA